MDLASASLIHRGAGTLLRLLLIALLPFALSGCPGVIGPGSRHYAPRGEAAKKVYELSRPQRLVFPDDVRAAPLAYNGKIVLWSSIVRSVEPLPDGAGTKIVFEHHYWDFIEDYGLQKEIAFLSPRGEGLFSTTVQAPTRLRTGDMALVYGEPRLVQADGTVFLLTSVIDGLPQGRFATDVWDYGRAWLVNGDNKDLTVLRRPGL